MTVKQSVAVSATDYIDYNTAAVAQVQRLDECDTRYGTVISKLAIDAAHRA